MISDAFFSSAENPADAFFTAKEAKEDRAKLIFLAKEALKHAQKNAPKTRNEAYFMKLLNKLAAEYYQVNPDVEVVSIVDVASEDMLLSVLKPQLPPDLNSEKNLAEDKKRSWCRII